MATHNSQTVAMQSNQQELMPATGDGCLDDKKKIVLKYLPMCRSMARKMDAGFDGSSGTDDLVSAGMLGLVEAMERYDAKKGGKLLTFAYLRIRGAMIDELRKRDWFPRSARMKAKRMEKASYEFESHFGRRATDEEMAKELGIDPADYCSQAREVSNLSVVSIEEMREMWDQDSDESMGEIREGRATPEDYAEAREELALVEQGILTLPARQQSVLRLYFYDDISTKEIAARFGVTESRISQIRSRGIAGLKLAIAKR